ncbi:MAG: dCMP deaminase family protein [Thermodesulfovibrionales bacterium]|nr:dCMP deaminase family protein [Thermodesulfovibrionales bacterium]
MQDSKKTHFRPGWDEYFLEIAKVVASRSTCLRRRYGAVIVKDNVIVSTGYNGAPRGTVNCIDSGTCKRRELNIPAGERYELCEAVHAEQNAIINGSPERMKDATIYIAGFEEDGTLANGKPCLLCQRMIKNAMISEIIYLNSEGTIIKTSVNALYDETKGVAPFRDATPSSMEEYKI